MADVAEYSRLIGVDEAGTLAELDRLLSTCIKPSLQRHHGRLIKLMGDGILAVFDSPINAVSCAIDIQERAKLRNDTLAAESQLHLHIGINLGDVVFQKNDVMGDAVNVASRLQGLANPREIIIADAVKQLLDGKISVELEDMGEQRLKNIPNPVRSWRLVAQATGPHEGAQEATTFPMPAVAVMPFLNLSGDASQRYFSDGITEDIITELSRFRTLSVIARTSSFVYRDTPVDVRRVGAELNAQFIVEGSVRKIDDRLRITVQLISAQDRSHVWAEKYDAEIAQLFAIQDDLTHRIVATIVPKLEAKELEGARRHPTHKMRAYDCYLRGKEQYYAADTYEKFAHARSFFEAAVKIDPGFARAYCFLAAIDNNMAATSGAGVSPKAFRDRARQLALKAVALDDSDPLTHLSVAWSHLWRREFGAARKHLDIATVLNPNDADRAMDRGTTLMYLGEPEKAIDVMTAGMRLNPFYPDSYRADLAEAYFAARRYDSMLQLAQQLPFRSAKFEAWKAAAFAYADRHEEARVHAQEFVSRVRSTWQGNAGAGESEFVAWMLSFCPFSRSEDVAHLLEGLSRAGLKTPELP